MSDMTTFSLHLVKWAVALTSFYVLYWACLRRETFHALKRWALLFILAASFALPFCSPTFRWLDPNASSSGISMERMLGADVQETVPTPGNPAKEHAAVENNAVKRHGVVGTEGRSVDAAGSGAVAEERTAAEPDWSLWLLWAYLAVAGVGMLLYVRAIVATLWLIHRGRRLHMEGVPADISVLASDRVPTPCSWMHWILLPDSLLGRGHELRAVLLHEQAHVRLRHSWDMILAELTARTLWPLPFAWLLRRELANVQEYEADQAVLAAGVAQADYDALLLAEATGARLRPVWNSFDQTQVKARLAMMYAAASSRLARLRVLYALPLIGVLVLLFACYKPKPSQLVGTWMYYGLRSGIADGGETPYKGKAHVYRVFGQDRSLMEVVTFEGTSDTRTQAVGTWSLSRAKQFIERIVYANQDSRGIAFPAEACSWKPGYQRRSLDVSKNADTLFVATDNDQVQLWVRVPDSRVQRSEPDVQRTSLAIVTRNVRQQDLPQSVREQPEVAALYAMRELLLIKNKDVPGNPHFIRLESVLQVGNGMHIHTKMFDESVFITMKQHDGRWLLDAFYPEDVFAKRFLQACIESQKE